MDNAQICRLVEQATSELGPITVTVLKRDEEELLLRTVSDSFTGLKLSQRFSKLLELIRKNSPELISTYMLAFEAWTSSEYEKIKSNVSNDEDDSDDEKKSASKLNVITGKAAAPRL